MNDPLQEVENDLAVDLRCADLAQGDLGLRHDIRLLTRRSMPTLWPNVNEPPAKQAVPDCAALVERAARYKRQQRFQEYEECMQALLAFFLCNEAAPARTPAEVRAAFRLDTAVAQDVCVQRNEQRLQRLAKFLERNATWQACCGSIDMTQVDALVNAGAERDSS